MKGELLRLYRTWFLGNEARGAHHERANPLPIDSPNPAPDSDDAPFHIAWNVAPTGVNFTKVLRAWRSQEVGP